MGKKEEEEEGQGHFSYFSDLMPLLKYHHTIQSRSRVARSARFLLRKFNASCSKFGANLVTLSRSTQIWPCLPVFEAEECMGKGGGPEMKKK